MGVVGGRALATSGVALPVLDPEEPGCCGSPRSAAAAPTPAWAYAAPHGRPRLGREVRRQRAGVDAGPNQFVAAELADLAPGTRVDLAAGEGRNAIWLASRGWSVTAVDFSQVALDKGARLAATWSTLGAAPTRPPGSRPSRSTWWCSPTSSCRPSERRVPCAAPRELRPGGHAAARRARLDQPHRGHRRPAGPGRADECRRRARRPRRASRSRWCARSGWPARSPRPRHGGEVTSTAWDCLVRVVRR